MDKKLVALLIISLSSFSVQAQAMSEQHLLTNQSSQQGALDHLFTQLSHFNPFSSKVSKSTHVNILKKNYSAGFANLHYERMIHVKTAGATGMFRRVVNAPSAGGKLNTSTDKQQASTKKVTLALAASESSGLGLQAKDFVWSIKSSDGSIKMQKKGKSISPALPTGKYTVKLTVGGNVVKKSITLSSSTPSTSFPINLGRLKSSASFDGGSAAGSSWSVYEKAGSKRGKKVYGPKTASSINRILKPGKYEVVVSNGPVTNKKAITISAGKTSAVAIHLEGSKVKLLVTKSDLKSPLIKKTKWVIKDTQTNRVVLTKNRHSATVTLPPGKYIASATSGGVTKDKSFVVKPGKENNIFVAME